VDALDIYGDIPLSELQRMIQGDRAHKCPKCIGKGTVPICVRPAEMGYWDAEYVDRNCGVCGGHGYTSREVKPVIRTEVVGYR